MPIPVATEAQWQLTVVHGALVQGWEVALRVEDAVYRVLRASDKADARRALALLHAWPDLVLVHPRRGKTLHVELKTDATKSQPTEAQQRRLALLYAGGNDVRVWRPRHWDDEVAPTLAGARQEARYAGIDDVAALYDARCRNEGWC